MDVTEYVDPIKIVLRQVKSLVDSFVFEVGQCVASRDQLKAELCIKRFRNHANSVIKEMEWEFDKFESGLDQIDVLKRIKKQEKGVVSLKNIIELGKEACDKLKNDNVILKNEISVMKNNVKHLECFNDEKDNIIFQLQQKIEDLSIFNQKEKEEIFIQEKFTNNEIEYLKEVVILKEKENKNIKNEKKEVEKKHKKMIEENLGFTLKLKEYEEKIVDYKSQIERCKNLEKVDQKNLINSKILLNNANDQLNTQEEQLIADFDLISKLKVELVNMQHKVEENSKISTELENERRTNLIFFKDIESLQIKSEELNKNVINLIEKNKNLKRKKEELKSNLQNVKVELSELHTQNEETKTNLIKAQSEISSVNVKLENLTKQNYNNRREIEYLRTAKSIADDKIRLLNTFVEDFRVVEHDFHTKLISENHSIRSRMDIIKDAYVKLF